MLIHINNKIFNSIFYISSVFTLWAGQSHCVDFIVTHLQYLNTAS